jgi:hypothetical protein
MFAKTSPISNCAELNYLQEKNCCSIRLDRYSKTLQRLCWAIKNSRTNRDRVILSIKPDDMVVTLIVGKVYPFLDRLISAWSNSTKSSLPFEDARLWLET